MQIETTYGVFEDVSWCDTFISFRINHDLRMDLSCQEDKVAFIALLTGQIDSMVIDHSNPRQSSWRIRATIQDGRVDVTVHCGGNFSFGISPHGVTTLIEHLGTKTLLQRDEVTLQMAAFDEQWRKSKSRPQPDVHAPAIGYIVLVLFFIAVLIALGAG